MFSDKVRFSKEYELGLNWGNKQIPKCPQFNSTKFISVSCYISIQVSMGTLLIVAILGPWLMEQSPS